jgi:hypothetical protein
MVMLARLVMVMDFMTLAMKVKLKVRMKVIT